MHSMTKDDLDLLHSRLNIAMRLVDGLNKEDKSVSALQAVLERIDLMLLELSIPKEISDIIKMIDAKSALIEPLGLELLTPREKAIIEAIRHTGELYE